MEGMVFLKLLLTCILSKSWSLSPENDNLVHSAVLDYQEKYHVFWNFDDEGIVFELQVQTLGYVGFGLSPSGDMTASDIVIGSVYHGDGTVYFTDRHAIGKQEPVVDESQDWILIRGSQNDTHTTLRFWRPLDTCDEADQPIEPATVRLIWAYSDEDADSEGAVKYHSGNRGSKSIYLLNPQKTFPEIPEDSLVVNFLNNKAGIVEEDTTYWCQAFNIPEVDRKHHVIKFEPVIEPGHEWLVHHILVMACFDGTTNETAGHGELCGEGFMPEAWRGCLTTLFAWAVGGGPFYFPEHVGFPFGFDEDPTLIVMQTHYDNSNLLKGITDSSGMRITLSPRPRAYDAGLLAMGVLVLETQMIPPSMEHFRSDGHCVPECLNQAMENHPDGIKFFAGFLHSHELGIAMKLRHFRDGIEQEVIIEDDNYDVDFQETRMLNEEVHVRPGDYLLTECYYRSMNRTKVTYGGVGSKDEMCLSAAMYYPRIPLSACESTIVPSDLVEFAGIKLFQNTTVMEPKEVEGLPYYVAMEQLVDWTDAATRERFHEHTTSTDQRIMAICFKDMDNIYPISQGYSEIPKIKTPLPEKTNLCGNRIGIASTLKTQPWTTITLLVSVSSSIWS